MSGDRSLCFRVTVSRFSTGLQPDLDGHGQAVLLATKISSMRQTFIADDFQKRHDVYERGSKRSSLGNYDELRMDHFQHHNRSK